MIFKDTPVGFHRVERGPLDSGELVLNGNNELHGYLVNQAAYSEQRLNVKYGNRIYRVRLIEKDNTLFPVVENAGADLIVKTMEDGHKYALIYYNNGGSKYDSANDYGRVSDVLAWDILPLMNIMAGTLEGGQMNFILTYNNEDHRFTSENFLDNNESENNDYFYNVGFAIGIMPKNQMDVETELWLQCDNYVALMGGM